MAAAANVGTLGAQEAMIIECIGIMTLCSAVWLTMYAFDRNEGDRLYP